MRIEVKDLTYVYSEKTSALATPALNGVSLTVEEGEFLGIIGQTGSGKTTFVQHLNGLIRLGKNNGSIKIGEYDLADKKCDLKGLRSKVGMVFQYPEYQLFADTVKEDVAFGLKNFYKDLTEQQIEQKVKEAIELVGLNYNQVKDKSPFELSGGQKRRVAIAGVIVTKPEILVLDEPVAGLDPKGKMEFINLLHTLHGSFVKTIIIVSHDMDTVAEHCSKIAVFSQGNIIATGTPKEVFSEQEKILETGLELPLTARILALTGAESKDLTIEEVVDAVAKKLGGNG